MDLQEAFDAGFEAVRAYVDQSFEAFEKRILAMEKRIAGVDAEQEALASDLMGVKNIVVDSDLTPQRPQIEAMIQNAVRAIPVARDGKDADPTSVAAIVAGDIRKDLGALQTSIDAMPRFDAQKAMGELETKCATMVEYSVQRAVAALPIAKDGKDGTNGVDGKDADPVMLKQMVTEAVMALPPAENGKDGAAGLNGKDGEPGRDGKSVTAEELVPLIEDRVHKAVSAIPVPKDGRDGVALAGAVIDRTGNLVLTLSDGTTRELGYVMGKDGANGRDGAPGERGADGQKGIDGMHGKDGEPGQHGKDGIDGMHGKDGADGINGKDGANGLDGKDGAPGRDGKDAEPVTKDQILEAILSTDAIPVAVQQYLEAHPPLNGKDGAPGLDGKDGVNGNDGAPGKDGRDGVDGQKGLDGKDGSDGRDGVDLSDLLVIEGGDVVATFTDGRTKVLGPFRGKDGKDADLATIDQMIRDAVAKHEPAPVMEEYVPDEVAANVLIATKMLAHIPTKEAPSYPAAPILQQPTMPDIHVAGPTINMPPLDQRKKKTQTVVTEHDEKGRIKSFIQKEIDD